MVLAPTKKKSEAMAEQRRARTSDAGHAAVPADAPEAAPAAEAPEATPADQAPTT